MECLLCPAAILYILLCFGLPQSQGNNVFQHITLKVSINRALQQLLLEWDVSDDVKSYHSEGDMVFNIQIYRSEENNIVVNENYTTKLNKSNRPLNWTWTSHVPLECMPHGVRIRSMVEFSNWTAWEIKDGMDFLDNGRSYIFPAFKVVEKGSSVTFCCIAKKNELLYGYQFDRKLCKVTKQRRITFTETDVPVSVFGGITVQCAFVNQSDNKGTSLYVTSKPDEPKNLHCETEDMTELKCTWDPGQITNYTNLDPAKCAANFTLSDVSNGQTYYSCTDKCISSKFKMTGEQMRYHLRLTTQNCLGQEQTDVAVDVLHRIHLAPPVNLSACYQNATAIQLCWHIKFIRKPFIKEVPGLLCQVTHMNSFYPGAEEKVNVTFWSLTESHPHINLEELQPYTKYTFKVRCAAGDDFFWKWSTWSETTIQTNESAPSGQLDIWREISPGLGERNITVFWKALPGFQANGIIKIYEICWENLEESNASSHCNSTALNNYTITLGSQSYKISVSARNSANASIPSVIIIAATGNNDTWNGYEENTTNNTADSIYISWKTQNTFDGYVIDWCNYPLSQPCGFQWRRFGQNVSSTLITSDDFSPGVRYTFGVYGLQGGRTYSLEKKVKYLKEQVLVHQPAFNISAITSRWLTINWESYPQNSHPGFIRGYNVYVKVEHGKCTLKEFEQLPGNPAICRHTIEDRNQKKYTVKYLEPSTTYLLAVQAYSVNPGNITHDKFKPVTTQSERNGILPLLLSLVIVPLLLIVGVCSWKSDCVRNCLIPEIPHPYVHPFIPPSGVKSPVLAEKSEITHDQLVVMKKPGVDKQPDLGRTQGLKIYVNPNYCQDLQGKDVASKKPNSFWTTYQPLQDFFTSKPTSSPLETVQDNLNYISQNKVPFCGVKQNNSARSVESLQPSNYKPQLTAESPPNSPLSDENVHLIAACSEI
ncbi:oncostatin-M-specific receptor subunit beta-like [Sceloporus undulatus]|uniref:oncostatin-M-specific receptor subunit beta-like n=1 Tax=Sceloporus undulatus TaxID=8520 RepID=UPI001C4B0B08|nr:oncostatin-M-specific receptor subunit beta-like [Sceloporus undulatus]XP_042308492.1 oncostatin-M-specific receptor subunit beta-like [Sceloporus undulatus]XP_042308493.1 oncostatin-M-specific receptor subunit beta-like [Sceloporus undulatus]